MRRMLLAIAIVVASSVNLDAQLLRRIVRQPVMSNCPGGVCTPIYSGQQSFPVYSAPIEQASTTAESASGWYTIFTGPGRQPTAEESQLAKQIVGAAVRCYQGNGCGTGNFVGRDSQYDYILTNAHVAGTKIGTVTRCNAVLDGQVVTFTARLIEAAYSNRYRTDWALLAAPAGTMRGVVPVPLSRTMPDPKAATVTWGHPRCVPTRGHSCTTVRFGQVWLWQPNSIGGQSGSAVVQIENGRPVQKGLLTWSEGGYGSGQFAATIWRQSQEQTVEGEMRTGNEVPVAQQEGYTREQINLLAVQLINENPLGVPLESGHHVSAEVALRDYPIWYDAEEKPPVIPGPVEPKPEPAPSKSFKVEGITATATLSNGHTITGPDVVNLKVGDVVTIGQAQEANFLIDFALYAWSKKDELQDKAQEILAFVNWLKAFIEDFNNKEMAAVDYEVAEQELSELLEETGYPVEQARGELIRGLIKYAIENPEQIIKFINLISGLFGQPVAARIEPQGWIIESRQFILVA